jgi:DNA-binding transcriptional ArsR family regulator
MFDMPTQARAREKRPEASASAREKSPREKTPREKIPHPDASALDLATIMRTLGDPLRLDIVRMLADGEPRTCGAIQDVLGLPASTGSYHLRLLREAGVTRTRAEGTLRVISLRRDDLEDRFPGLVDVLTR